MTGWKTPWPWALVLVAGMNAAPREAFCGASAKTANAEALAGWEKPNICTNGSRKQSHSRPMTSHRRNVLFALFSDREPPENIAALWQASSDPLQAANSTAQVRCLKNLGMVYPPQAIRDEGYYTVLAAREATLGAADLLVARRQQNSAHDQGRLEMPLGNFRR